MSWSEFPHEVNIKKLINQPFQDNRRISSAENISKMNINHGKKWCKNGL
jgi:hypothetical protein